MVVQISRTLLLLCIILSILTVGRNQHQMIVFESSWFLPSTSDKHTVVGGLPMIDSVFVIANSNEKYNINSKIGTNNKNDKNTSSTSTSGTYELCFVTSVFADDLASSDIIANVTEHRKNNPGFQFFLFTNRKDLLAPGWTKIIPTTTLHYHRMITQSRWAKFVPWQHEPTKRNCPVIFYMDGYTVPKNTPQATQQFRDAAKLIREHPFGLGQYPKRGSKILKLAKGLVREGKDTADNVNYTITWLQEQPDFRHSCTVYLNRHFGFDPQNLNYQNLSLYFWDLYRQEKGSWRDQLLWCYVVDKFQAHPIDLHRNVSPMKHLFEERRDQMGYNGHKYVTVNDVNQE